jgi:hypothetical protein
MGNLQAWIAIVGGLLTAALGILKYFNYHTRRDRMASVGQTFNSTIDGLSSESEAKKLAGAILLRRFFDSDTEQGDAEAPYGREAIAVIAALLKGTATGELQKLLADGLGYAPSLKGADLQGCNLAKAYLGQRHRARTARVVRGRLIRSVPIGWTRQAGRGGLLGDQRRDDEPVDLSKADLFGADLTGASLRGVVARETVFFTAILRDTVLKEAQLQGANFREADLEGANFEKAYLAGAQFQGARNIPTNVELLLNEQKAVPQEMKDPVLPS